MLSNLKKIGLVVLVLALGLFGAYLTRPIPDPKLVTISKQDLYRLTLEWALYREVAVILFAEKNHVSKEDATKYLDFKVKEGANTLLPKFVNKEEK